MRQTGPVPVIDLAPFRDGGAGARQVARQVDDACRDLGFLVVRNHGAAQPVIQSCWEAAASFFDAPSALRRTGMPAEAGHPYGYQPFQAEALARSLGEETPPDLKETFNVGPLAHPAGLDPAAAAFAYRENIWPKGNPQFRRSMEAYYREMRRLADTVMQVCATALDLPPDYFAAYFACPMSALRVINYPSPTAPPLAGQLRAGAHTDYGALTLLLQQTGRSGLQVLSRGEWHDVPALPDTFVINIGDLMARWTNDRWVSTLHRVVNPDPEAGPSRRQSLVFFHTPDWDASISCLPSCVVDGAAPAHPPIQAGPHLAMKFARTVQ